MATYQVTRDMRTSDINVHVEAMNIATSVVVNAVQGYGMSMQDISMDGAGRLRVRVSGTFPPEEVASFGGDIVEV